MAVLLRRFPGKSHIPDCEALFSRKPMWNHAFGRHFSAGETEAQCHSGLTSSATVRQNASLISGQLRGCHFMGDFIHGRIVMTNTLEDDVGRHRNEFKKWHNGGGMVHKSACIDPTALIEVSATVHSKSLVGAKAHIGSGTIIGPEVTIGQSTKIGYNVAVSNCTIGDSCVIHHGVSIGQDGFGFFIDEQGKMVKKPQELKAKIGNNVEIGANSCIDRGSWRDTVIGDNSKIDNLVQIGHNVVIGKSCMLCGQVGIAGSVTMGEYVTLGGRVGVRDHVSIVSKVRLAANSCVTKDINEPGDYGGFPAVPIHKWRRQVAFSRRTSV